MSSFRLEYPAKIKEFIAPAAFVDDLDLQERIVDSKMTRDYALLVFVCATLLIIAILM